MFASPLSSLVIPPPRNKRDSQVKASPKAVFKAPAFSEPDVSSPTASRRQLLATLAAMTLSQQLVLQADAAQPRELVARYYDETADVHSHLRAILDAEGPPKTVPEAVEAFKKDSQEWVADYRRTIAPSRKSYAETYGAISALQGHFTSTGFDRPLPNKLRENVSKRLNVAETALKREKSKLAQS
jgi:hypothetical protein